MWIIPVKKGYGQVVIDYMNVERKAPNATFCKKLDGQLFKKKKLFELII